VSAGCPELAPPQVESSKGRIVELAVLPLLDGKNLAFGEPNMLADGTVVMPLDFRFYVSEVALLEPDGSQQRVDLVTAAGVREPYGVHLVNAEDPPSMTLRILAPPRAYSGLSFTLGLDDLCNMGPATRGDPLSEASQMTWPHLGAGYLFLRYEAEVSAPSTPDASSVSAGSTSPAAVHMGGVVGQVFAPTARAPGDFTVASTNTVVNLHLRMSMDRILQAAVMPVNPSPLLGIPTPDVLAGEALRQAIPTLAVFSLAP
jgi:hypothetical protein